MEVRPADRSGVLVVRLWLEPSHAQVLRARITQTLDPLGNERSVAVASSSDDICAVVKRWVEDFLSWPPGKGPS